MTSGVLSFGRFLFDIFCWIEQVDEIKALTVFEVVAVGEELDVFVWWSNNLFCFGLTVSRVGFAVHSIQINIVWASTAFKTRLPTLVYGFCTDDVNFNRNMSGEENIDEEGDTCIEVTPAAEKTPNTKNMHIVYKRSKQSGTTEQWIDPEVSNDSREN